MAKQTKIIATLGPASSDTTTLTAMVETGVDLVRHNLSHGTLEEHCRRAALLREVTHGKHMVGQIFDLQGPKLRIERFAQDAVILDEGQTFVLDPNHAPDAGNKECVGIAYRELPKFLKVTDRLLVDDGKIVLQVEDIVQERIVCRVHTGGRLASKKGINLQGGGLAAPALTSDDKQAIDQVIRCAAPDYFAVSFVSCAEDITTARALIRESGSDAGVIAKIERKSALANLGEIIAAADAVMVARGDLGVEIGDAALPAAQKRILRQARMLNTPVIVATEMMRTMIDSPLPTRAEVMDVANAVLAGTDAVMLSEETAIGKHPARVIAKIVDICREAEGQPEARLEPGLNVSFSRVDETIAMAAMYAATHSAVDAVLAFTETGNSTRWMSRVTSCTGLPIFALTPHAATLGRVTLYRSVLPVAFNSDSDDYVAIIGEAVERLKGMKLLRSGNKVIVTRGPLHHPGAANLMEILTV